MNRVCIRPPTAKEHETLTHWLHSGRTAWYQRARTVQLAAAGTTDATALARTLGLHPNTTRRWLHTFDRQGVAALAPKPRGGRARQFGEELVDALIALLHEPPEQHGAPDESGRSVHRRRACTPAWTLTPDRSSGNGTPPGIRARPGSISKD